MSVTSEHEALHRVFQHDPGLYSRAVERALGVKLAIPGNLSELSVDLTETRPVERRADSVLRAEFPAGTGGPSLRSSPRSASARPRPGRSGGH